ncbi:MAG: (Fe-S)-binding protein [Candidatus Odinarchaeia archaeon]
MTTKLNSKLTRSIIDAINKCSQCGKCRSICPTFDYKKIESYNERGRIMLYKAWNDGELEPDDSFIDRVYTCLLCRVCEETCPPQVKYMEIAEAVRGKLVEEGLGPIPEQKQSVETIMKTGNVFGQENKLNEGPLADYFGVEPKDADYYFFVGCMFGRNYVSHAINAIKILQKAGLTVGLDKDEKCCSGVAKLQGMNKEFDEYATKNVEHIESLQPKKIFTQCPMCYAALKKEYPWTKQIEIYHAAEVFADLLKQGKLKPTREVKAKAVFFDSCHLGRWSGVYDAPREVIKAIPGLEIIELERNRNLSRCCGGPIRVPYVDFRNDASGKTLEEVEEIGADFLITPCDTCLFNLQSVAQANFMEDLQIVDISEILAYSLGIIDSIPQYELDV